MVVVMPVTGQGRGTVTWLPSLPLALPLWCRAAPLGDGAWPAPPSAPRSCRQSGVGLCSMAARVAGIIAPLIRLLEQYHRAVPMAIFGSAPVLGGLLCFLLPETRGTELVDDTRGGRPAAEACENANSSSENGQVKVKDGGQDNEYTKTTYF